MPKERIEDFANRVRELKEFGDKYQPQYEMLEDLLKAKGPHIEGKINIPGIHLKHNTISNLIVDLHQWGAAGTDISFELWVPLRKTNRKKVYEYALPNPYAATAEELEEMFGEEVLERVLGFLTSDKRVLKRFKTIPRSGIDSGPSGF